MVTGCQVKTKNFAIYKYTIKEQWDIQLVKLLYHQTRVFRYFINKEYFPLRLTNFQKIPNPSNARWSTRAILVSCNARIHSDPICCSFICYNWAEFWFTDQRYQHDDCNKLKEMLKPYKKASNTLQRHWNQKARSLSIG